MAEAVHNKGSLMEPVRTVDEQRVRLEHHLLELLEHERDYLAKKHQLLLKGTAAFRLVLLFSFFTRQTCSGAVAGGVWPAATSPRRPGTPRAQGACWPGKQEAQ